MPASTEPPNSSIVYLPYCPLYCPLLQNPLAPWYSECAMARVNIVKQIKVEGRLGATLDPQEAFWKP
jgi:hypothetical protein